MDTHKVTIRGIEIEPRKITLLSMASGLGLILLAAMIYQVNIGGSNTIVQAPPAQELVQEPVGQQTTGQATPSNSMGASMGNSMGGMSGMFANISEETAKNAGMLMQKMQSEPQNIENILELALLFYENKEYATMLNFTKRARSINPTNSKAAYLAGIAYSQLGDFQNAVTSFQESLIGDDNPATRYNIAYIYINNLNEKAKAKVELEKALQSPNLPTDLKQDIEKLLTGL